MPEDKKYCLFYTSDSEIEDQIAEMRSNGIKLPDKIDHDEVVRYYKKNFEWSEIRWQEWLSDSIKSAAES